MKITARVEVLKPKTHLEFLEQFNNVHSEFSNKEVKLIVDLTEVIFDNDDDALALLGYGG